MDIIQDLEKGRILKMDDIEKRFWNG